jgi:hypothetical protein
MSEQEPSIAFNVKGKTVEGKRDNTFLFTFAGELACFDHIYLVLVENGEPEGLYMWNSNKDYADLSEFMIASDYSVHLNLRDVAPQDEEAWQRHHLKGLEDTFPEDWVKK